MSDIKFKASLDTGNIDKKLGDAARSVDKVAAESKKASRALDGLKKAMLGITAAATGLTAIARSAGQMGREVTNLARVAGVSAQSLQAMAYAAQTVGVEQDKLADIFKDVNDKIGDFMSTGAGPMADFFDHVAPKVGVTAEQFRGLSGPQALGLYVDTLQRAGVSQQQMTFYMEALASDSTLLFDLFRDGGAEMNRLTGEFERLGLGIDAAKLKPLSDDFQLFGQVFRKIAANIGEALVPVFNKLALAIKESLEPGGKLRAVLDALKNPVGALKEVMGSMSEEVQRAFSYFTAFAVFMAGRFVVAVGGAAVSAVAALAAGFLTLRGALIRTGIGALIVALGEAINYMINLSNEVGGVKNAFEVLGRRIGIAFQGAFATAKQGWASFLGALQNGFNWIKRQITEAFTFDIELPQWYKDLTGSGDISVKGPQFEESTFAEGAIQSANEASAAYQQALADFNAWKEGLIAANREVNALPTPTEPGTADVPTPSMPAGLAGRGIDAMTDKVETLRDKLNEWRKSMSDSASQLSDLITGTYAKMEDSLVNFVMTGKMNFKDLMASMAADLIRFSIRSAAMKIFTAFLGPVPSRMGNAFGASGQLNFANGGVFNQKFAMPMGDGRTAIGAESGPEAIMPLQRGKDGRLGVVANGGTGSGGAQIVNNFNTTVNPPPNSKPEDARAFAREFNRAVEAKVVETMSKVQNVGIGGRR